jgi:glycosyltransferase involved in cell wall biosynthesis
MKVLHVEGGRHLHGGAYQVLHLVTGLAARGYESLLVCPRGSELAAAARPFADVREMTMHGDLDAGISLRLLALLRDVRPDLVHLHSRIGADIWGGLAARLARLPAVHTRRVDNPEPRWLVALKYRLHDRIIAISEEIGRVLISEGLPVQKLRVVRSAVDWEPWARPCDRRRVAALLGVPTRSILVCVVAQLIGRKGHRFLIDVLPHVASRHPNLKVFFFGRGPLEGQLREAIKAAGLNGVIKLGGFRNDLEEILGCFDLLVHPATMEGLGVSLLQAASAGLPIVASRVGGIPEVVRDRESGILVEPEDSQALGAAIETLLADANLRRDMGDKGRELMAKEFPIDSMVEGNLRVYRELLEQRRR